ncbi:TetR/AcrR family transcriptional regulator [Methylobacterium oryzisoli]|uniref:TetR/AcrR family transcriptional regulator n=1 Tax=Methylobacterium oryzisoli TaxID=3385502 RepID=UPI0038927BCC
MPVRRKTGRPLSFDRDAALEQAMRLFWRHGYEATSLAALTRAMGVTPPSIYAAFGDKKGLFLEAVARYLARPLTPAEIIARAPTAREAARGLIEGAAVAFTGADTPPGCLLASSAIACSAEAADVRDELAAIRRGVEESLRARIEQGVRDGELAADADAETLAAYVTTVIQGMSTLARDGATREKLTRVAEFAMLAWPSAWEGAASRSA